MHHDRNHVCCAMARMPRDLFTCLSETERADGLRAYAAFL